MVDAAREPAVIFGRLGSGIVIQENQIEVRGVTQLFAAELAVSDDGKSRHVAVALLHTGPCERQHFAQYHTCKIAQMIRQRL
jgi:hypothetical protein